MIGEMITLAMMAFALGMDAFSVSLGMGLLQLRLKQIAYIGLTVGFFHIVMPLAGIVIGRLLSVQLGHMATYIGGVLLFILGVQMVVASFRHEQERWLRPVGIGLFLFAFSVSLDSFSVGLSLGIYGVEVVFAVIAFGLTSMVLTWMGLLLGRRFQRWLGTYSEALGGTILLLFACKLLFPL
ncbi:MULTISPECIES: manganese efflux pump MntP [Anoxybacillus]|uniref:Putative manganese efflux pump MntP n=1 Tax=Anoxybacillus mongoliensis TaxID=452565 RepID=A0A7W8JGU7_9BACL|nr:manganese efflux pump MntP family protein [Anoxybacillus mongoliensis]MBB5355449.1 putative Mn2+ efflux pump MntP [Anoxybacillus mongoliensis]MCX8003224.1 manganese efflux pump MntP family protein [Anoxybacillus mongoliensis]